MIIDIAGLLKRCGYGEHEYHIDRDTNTAYVQGLRRLSKHMGLHWSAQATEAEAGGWKFVNAGRECLD